MAKYTLSLVPITDYQRRKLYANGIKEIDQVKNMTDEQILSIRGIGKKCLETLRNYNVPEEQKLECLSILDYRRYDKEINVILGVEIQTSFIKSLEIKDNVIDRDFIILYVIKYLLDNKGNITKDNHSLRTMRRVLNEERTIRREHLQALIDDIFGDGIRLVYSSYSDDYSKEAQIAYMADLNVNNYPEKYDVLESPYLEAYSLYRYILDGNYRQHRKALNIVCKKYGIDREEMQKIITKRQQDGKRYKKEFNEEEW